MGPRAPEASRQDSPRWRVFYLCEPHPPAARIRTLAAGLAAVERSRYRRAASDKARTEFVLGRALLRYALRWVTGDVPAVSAAATGKLVVSGDPGRTVRVSLSHSRGHYTAVVSEHGQMGVDVQELAPIPHEAIAARFFRPEELELMRACGDPTEAFYRLWTVKEACAKALGAPQLSLALRRIGVTLEPSGTHGDLLWQALDVGSDAVAAVAFKPDRADERYAGGVLITVGLDELS